MYKRQVRKAIIAKDDQGKIIPEGATDVTGLLCSDYQNTDGKEVFVMINYAAEDKEFTFYQRNGCLLYTSPFTEHVLLTVSF